MENNNVYTQKPASQKQKNFIANLLRYKKNIEMLVPMDDLSSRDAGSIIDYLKDGTQRNAYINKLLRYRDPQIIPNLDGGHIYAEHL